MTLYSEIDQEDYCDSLCIALLKKRGSGKFPNDQEIKTALHDKDLYNTQSKNRSYFFELLENFNNREYVNTASELITIEHIFPRNPDNKWIGDLTPNEYIDFKENKLNTIANLTLSGNNGALSNLSFIDKRDMNTDGKEQGYAFSRLWLNDYLKKQECWNLEKYNERFEIIYDRFINIWELPKLNVPTIDVDSEQNIFDAEPPTNKKLEYFIFEDTKVDEVHVAQMYFYVLRSLYEKNPELLLESNQIIKLSKTASDFRTPQELVNGYFIEANIDSNAKFSYLKKILSVFELEDELIIKYNSEISGGADRFSRRRKFWGDLLPQLNHQILFTKVNPTRDFWLSAGAGISGLSYTLLVTKSYAAIEVTIHRASKEENKRLFNLLESHKNDIEGRFGQPLLWEIMSDAKMSRIKYKLDSVNFYVDGDIEIIKDFFITNLGGFYDAFNPVITMLKGV
jgi:DNA replication protein DnaD